MLRVDRQSGSHIKTFRDIFCQINIDRNSSNLSAVSFAMGHRTTKTTEDHYRRMKTGKVLNDLQKAWEAQPLPNFNTP